MSLPLPLVLPVVSIVLLGAALALAGLAACRAETRNGSDLTLRDVAGLLALLSFCSGIFSSPGEFMPLIRSRMSGASDEP